MKPLRWFISCLLACIMLFSSLSLLAQTPITFPLPNVNGPALTLQGVENQVINWINALYYQLSGNTSGGSGLPVYTVQSYGAKCDGKILYAGVVTTSGSNVVNSPFYAFTAADVGATVNIVAPAPINSYSASPPTSFTSTISSVSGGNAHLAGNVTFSSSAYQQASMRWYHTVDTVAIQNALNAGASAPSNVVFPGGGPLNGGVCVSGPLTFYTGEKISGQGMGASIVMLANGSNSDLFVGYQFASLTGTGTSGASTWGVGDFSFEDIQLDGNRGANTGQCQSGFTGYGSGVRVYGYEFTSKDLLINNFAGDGWYSEWSTAGGTPCGPNDVANSSCENAAPDGMEAMMSKVKTFNNACYGIYWNGPHDSKIENLFMLGQGVGGIYIGGIGTPVQISHAHGYAEANSDFVISSNVACDDCRAETGMTLTGINYTLTNDVIQDNGLIIGVSGGGQIYNIDAVDVSVNSINNSLGLGTGFQDQWLGGYVGSISGSYVPQTSMGVIGTAGYAWGMQVGYYGATTSWTNGGSWPVVIGTTSNSVGYIQNGGVNIAALSAGGQWSFGPGVSSASFNTDVGFDLSAYNSSGNSAISLPQGTTAARPATPKPGEMRYNTSGWVEVYTSQWNILTSR